MRKCDRTQKHLNKEKVRENARKRKEAKDIAGRKKPGKRLVSNLILVIALAVFVYSGYQLYKIYSEYHKGTKEYKKIQTLVIKNKTADSGNDKFTVDFEALKGINPDVSAWIRFEQPEEINYPVVQGKDNDEYLYRTFKANDNKAGTLFIDAGNRADFQDKNTFIYGHNMKNGTMFAKLMKYKSKEYYEQNPYFYIYTPDGKTIKYQVCAATILKDTSNQYEKIYSSDEEWQAYIEAMMSGSRYATNATVTADSQIVSLSTCTNVSDDERFLVQGVKVGEE